jgi:hypothetical protein
MKIRLTKRFAERIDGVDLSQVHTGDVLDVPPKEARILVNEGWADIVGSDEESDTSTRRIPDEFKSRTSDEHAEAADRPRRKR